MNALLGTAEATNETRTAVEMFNEAAAKQGDQLILSRAQFNIHRDEIEMYSKAMERADDDTRSLTNALVDASADWIKFKSDIKAGKIDPKYDITDKLMEAVAEVLT